MKVNGTPRRDVFAPPVSYAQERLWFLEQFEPGTPLYNIPYIATIRGSVHYDAFNRAVNRLIERHESLRTCFVEVAGEPKQVIHPELSVEVGWHDLRRFTGRAATEQLQQLCTAVTNNVFDLTKAPLFRVALVGLSGETTIITTIHHIISDGWSIGVFQRELSALYQEELGGRAADLPELKIQYADFTIWQRERLQGEGLAALRDYWVERLKGSSTLLEIPGDYPRPEKQTFRGDVHMFDITAYHAGKLEALSREYGVTLFMTLFAAFSVLLSRITGQSDILVGTPIAGRKNAEMENIIGLFVNTLVLRAEIDPSASFTSLLAQIKTTTLEAFEHQDMPFEKLVLELNPERDLAHSPLIQILFTLQNIPPLQDLMADDAGAPASASQNLDGHTDTAKFDFALFVSEVGDKLQCSIEYNIDLFSAQTIQDIGEFYVNVIDQILESPSASISSYRLLTPKRRQAQIDASRGPEAEIRLEKGCHRLFEQQVKERPDAAAICTSAGKTVTYSELDAYTNRLARFLKQQGVHTGDRVGLCLDRGKEQVAAVLGLAKIGATYVPLDPTYPKNRLAAILADVQASLVLSSSTVDMVFEADMPVISLDEQQIAINTFSAQSFNECVDVESALYVIHTSGSTGRPKGVAMPHRSLLNLINWQMRNRVFPPGTVTLQYASLNFDVATQEIFTTLASGGCLQLVDDNLRRESPRLLEFLRAQNVERIFLPPVALEQLAIAACERKFHLDALKQVVVAGDRLQITDSVRDFFAEYTDARLENQYGPTESHVVSSHTLSGSPLDWPAFPPIGKAIDNVQLYVLDECLEPVPNMVAGELYIGGLAVALGYFGRDEETRLRFIRDPFSSIDRCLYRSGDIARYEKDGTLTFLGRADHQIKLRGFRIEPGEIEIALKQHQAIRDAIVIKRTSAHGDDHLVAYVVGEPNMNVESSALRIWLSTSLPAYMIPNHFVALDRFPLTTSGKIDRRKLPAVQTDMSHDAEREHVEPRMPVERFLADCWREVLHVERVSIHDNFFDLGGHSLSATQLVSRIRDQFDIELPLYRVFERPTLELLAIEIVQQQALNQREQVDLEALLSELESLSDDDSEILLTQQLHR